MMLIIKKPVPAAAPVAAKLLPKPGGVLLNKTPPVGLKPPLSISGAGKTMFKPGLKIAPKPAIAQGFKKGATPEQISKGFSVLKRGAAAQEALDNEERKAELSAKNSTWRFMMKEKTDTAITFLDGELVNGIFDNPFCYEHFVKVAGKPTNFVCVAEEGPCPICESGNRNSYVCYFTVIDHSVWVDKNGEQQTDRKRLFVAKRGTLQILLKAAQKRGGLRGCRFDVTRSTAKDAIVGNIFDFTEKYDEATLQAGYPEVEGSKNANHLPYNYDEIIGQMYMSGDDLRKFGFGAGHVGDEPTPGEHEDFSGQM